MEQTQSIAHLQVLLAGTIGMAILVVSLILFVVKYQKKRFKHQLEKNAMQDAFEKEILQARLEVQEQTFTAISQEIHDNIGQVLSLVRLNISTLNFDRPENANKKIASSKELLDQAIEDLRNLSKLLNRDYLRHQTLPELLQYQLELVAKTGLFKTNFKVQGPERKLKQNQKLIVYRIAQEALHNALKHSGAENITICLTFLPDKTLLQITDDGKGFDEQAKQKPGKRKKGFGQYSLAQRAQLINASYTLNSKPGQGTEVIVTIPYLP